MIFKIVVQDARFHVGRADLDQLSTIKIDHAPADGRLNLGITVNAAL